MASNKNALNDSPSLTACQFPAFLSQNEANPTGCLFPARRVAARDSIQLSTDPNDVELWIYNSPVSKMRALAQSLPPNTFGLKPL
eukprot:scaffold322565_cov19-Tisochrysis_lutea.AAC.1